MNGKISAVIIAFLLGIIGYQSGILDNFFHKGKKCNSPEVIKLTKEIAIDKIMKPALNKIGNDRLTYEIDNMILKTIITKKYDRETGYHECSAESVIVGTFKFNGKGKKTDKDIKMFFNLIFGSDNVIPLGYDQYKIFSPVWYSTEITDDRKQFYVRLKFNGDRKKYLRY